MVECAGCGQQFSVKGYAHHVYTTSHFPCLTVYNEEVMQIVASLYDVAMSNMVDDGGPDDALPPDAEVLDWNEDCEMEESDSELNNDDVDITDKMQELPRLPDEDGPATSDDRRRNPQDQPRAPEPDPVTGGDWDIEEYPITTAAAPLTTAAVGPAATYDEDGRLGRIPSTESGELYAPFQSRLDWELARWAKCETVSSSALTRLLSIDGITEALGLSYKNVRELNLIIDCNICGGRPSFKAYDITVGNEVVTLHARDILDCVEALYGDPDFAPFLIFKPERHYHVSAGHAKTRVYHDMHTGDWWWEVQTVLERSKPGATIVPLIVTTDRTQVTLFGNKTAYPMYLTIGNIPKDIRRKSSRQAHILLAYLPTTKLKYLTNAASRRRTLTNLFHACMARIVKPLCDTGINGVIMKDGNGVQRRIHPILAAFIGDYPEQVLVTGTKTGECPKCNIDPEKLGSFDTPCAMRNLEETCEALRQVDLDAATYRTACKNAGVKPIYHPFWELLPFVNIYQAITPDVLHQLLQGLLKHLLSWLAKAYGAAEIDARSQRQIPNHHIRIFANGITGLSRVTGKEHDLMGRIFLALVVGAHLQNNLNPSQLVHMVHAFLDFLYLARLPRHSSHTLHQLKDALKKFHDNKSIFVNLNIRKNFKIPKLHSLRHYVSSIKLFGATDNYNTQHTEHLHSVLAKPGYRASNKRDEVPQMTSWLERREKLYRKDKNIRQQLSQGDNKAQRYVRQLIPSLLPWCQIRTTRFPSVRQVPIQHLISHYGATNFQQAFARFAIQQRCPRIRRAQMECEVSNFRLPFTTTSVYHVIKFREVDQEQWSSIADSIHIRPSHYDKNGRLIPGRFDVALLDSGRTSRSGIHALRATQIRVVFSISREAANRLFPHSINVPELLAYVEWFSPFQAIPNANYGLYKVSRTMQDNSRLASIVPICHVVQSIHLIPLVGDAIPREWSSSTILDNCSSFLLNSFSDMRTYCLFNNLH